MPYKDLEKKRAMDRERYAAKKAALDGVKGVKVKEMSHDAIEREKERLRLRGEWRKVGRIMQQLLRERGINVKMTGIGERR